MRRRRRRSRKGLSFHYSKEDTTTKRFGRTLVWVLQIAAVVLLAFLLVTSFGYRATMNGYGMEPTLENGDTVLLNRAIYRLSSPRRGDIVAFYPNGNKKSRLYIRRVVAIPGDTVQIRNGKLYVNEQEVELDGLVDPELIKVEGIAAEEIELSTKQYFVIGDSPNSSEDSRQNSIGLVSKEDMEGRAYLIISPRSRFGTIN